jgi:hypothetical protein
MLRAVHYLYNTPCFPECWAQWGLCRFTCEGRTLKARFRRASFRFPRAVTHHRRHGTEAVWHENLVRLRSTLNSRLLSLCRLPVARADELPATRPPCGDLAHDSPSCSRFFCSPPPCGQDRHSRITSEGIAYRKKYPTMEGVVESCGKETE